MRALYPFNYENRHHFYIVLLKVICDPQKMFWDVSLNAPGGAHDADHWNCSAIKKMYAKERGVSNSNISN